MRRNQDPRLRRRPSPARRLVAALVVLAAVPALLATSQPEEAFELQSVDVWLQQPRPERAFRVGIEVEGLDDPQPVRLGITFDGEAAGNPPTLTLVVRTPDGEVVEDQHEGFDWRPDRIELGTCDQTCSYDLEVRVGAGQPGPGWKGALLVSARAGEDATGYLRLKVVPTS